jgi:hypothetical protein
MLSILIRWSDGSSAVVDDWTVQLVEVCDFLALQKLATRLLGYWKHSSAVADKQEKSID